MATCRRRTRRDLLATCLLLCSILLVAGLGAATADARSHAVHSSATTDSSRAIAVAARALARPLRGAATDAARYDRALVADAKQMKRCRAANPAHPRRCRSMRRALQKAGSRLAGAERTLSQTARATGANGPTAGAGSASTSPNPRLAPRLFVSGLTLAWTRVAAVDTYVLARTAPGQATQYSVVSGTSTTPPPAPGASVRYSVRTTALGSSWSAEQSISYPPASELSKVPDEQAAPTIAVSGETLTWNAVPGVSAYVLVRKVPGQADRYSEVSGTSVTPPALAGASVHYSVRTAVEGSAWAAEVSISYPSEPEPTPPSGGPAPPQEAPQGSATFQPGINSGSAAIWELPGAKLLGAKVVRVAFSIEASASELEPVIGAYAEAGIRVDALACFEGTLPTPAQAHNLATWASTFGPGGSFWSDHPGGQDALQAIELGNETSFSWQYSSNTPAAYASRAQTYALRAAEAAVAIRAANPGVGLLVQADSGNAGATWVQSMFEAVPDLGSLVAGWTVHPYGTHWREKLEELVSQTAAAGAPATIPIDVTEWGLSSDNGACVTENYGWNPCMSYQEAAEVLSRTVSEMRAMLHGRLGMLLLYKIRDQKPVGASEDREDYFGAVQSELQPKGAYTTAVESLLAGS